MYFIQAKLNLIRAAGSLERICKNVQIYINLRHK